MKAICFVFCCLALVGSLCAEGGDPWKEVVRQDGSGNLDQQWGPDAFGYRAKDSSEPDGPTPLWTDISSYGTLVTGLDDDNAVGPFPIGFLFHYYWYDVHQFWVGSNGYIKFSSTGQIAAPFPSFPDSALPNDVIAPYLTDWVFGPTNTSSCHYWSNNTDTLIVMFANVNYYHSGGSHDFELILSGADSSISFQYGDQSGSVSTTFKGIENLTGRVGLTTQVTPLVPNSAIRFYYPDTINYTIHDLAIVAVQNPLSEGFFVFPGDTLRPWIQIANMGNVTETSCSLHVVVPVAGLQLDTLLVGAIAPLDTITFVSPTWCVLGATSGYSITARIGWDDNTSNNAMRTECTVVNLPGELGYDDGQFDQVVGWTTPNRATAVQFVPPIYPVAVTRTALFVTNSSGGSFDGVIYDDSGPGGSPGRELWRYTVPNTHFGWDTVAVPADSVIIRAGSFFVSVWASGLGYGGDNTFTLGASRRTWEFLGSWGQNKWWNTANVMIRCSVTPLHPPGPFLRVAPADTFAGQGNGVWVTCIWTTSHDPDNDSVRYVFHCEHRPGEFPPSFPSDTVTHDTSLVIHMDIPTDPATIIENYYWTVRATDGVDTTDASNGEGHFWVDITSAVDAGTTLLPHEFALRSYPNPFNSTAMLSYDLPKTADVELRVFNLVGEVVTVLHEGRKAAGRYRAEWNASAQASGTYFAVMKAGNVTKVQKMLLLK